MDVNDVKDKKAFQKVEKAMTVLIISQPFFGALALHLNKVEDEKGEICKTMAVDGVNMFYYPPFVHKMSEVETQGVVAHEVMHCALQHMIRRGYRHPVLYNCAGDYVINGDLKKAGFSLPGNPISLQDMLNSMEKKLDEDDDKMGHLHDPAFDNMSTEEIYEKINQAVDKKSQSLKNKLAACGGKKGKGQGQGQGKGQGGNIDIGTCGGVIDAAGAGDKHKADEIGRNWDATVRMAVNVAKRANAGNVPGYLERLVKTLEAGKADWRALTRQFIDVSMTKDYSWSRPNRRHVSNGLHLPGFIADALHHMVFVVDTSGSITDRMLQAMVSEMASALNDGAADKLTVVYADTEVRHVDEWVQGDLVTAKIHGGGGTAFADSFKWINKNANDAQCIVYLTDMLTSEWGEDIGIPTMWAAYLPVAQLAQIKPPFGDVIAVDTSEV